jgi:hypothetical protein
LPCNAGEIMKSKCVHAIPGRYCGTDCGKIFLFFLLPILCLSNSNIASSQLRKTASPVDVSLELKMTRSVMCEDVKENKPYNEGLTFSSDLGKISCYTEFDPVPERTSIYHCWYFNNNLSTRRKLILNPPRWSALSQIQVRETEKGPWRVEITDEEGNILQTLRFSITD